MKKLLITLTLPLLLFLFSSTTVFAQGEGDPSFPPPQDGVGDQDAPRGPIDQAPGNVQPGIGTIEAPSGVVDIGNQSVSDFIAGFIRNGIWLLIIVAFVIAVIWMIFAGYSFIFANGDPKNISTAWSRIYWGLLGLVIVLGAFAIIKLVETFFGIEIISGGFQLPTRSSP
ncbi:MAG: pilin [Candidatus Curtissbacteria bacterium]|nr:pilin [Candidatus Curtissbacteria bacterium]